MLKRVVSEAIMEARDKELKEYVEGARHTYTVISASVQRFREKNVAKEDQRKRSGRNNPEHVLTASQAEEIYNRAFDELPIFGMCL